MPSTSPTARGSWAQRHLRRVLVGLLAAALLAAGATVAAVRPWEGGGDGAGTPGGHGAPTPSVPGQAAAPQDVLGPVVLVPGYGGSRASLEPLADRIRAAGRRAVIITLPGNGTGDLRAQEAVLAKEISTLRGNGAPPVDVIGYSAGGVVAALYVTDHGTEGNVRRVVSLGSPLHGTSRAAIAAFLVGADCPAACRQLRPGSPVVTAAAKADPRETGVPWLSLWTTLDELVVPPDSARLPGAVDVPLQSVCADDAAEHGGLPTDPLAVGIVLTSLRAAPLPTPGPSSCTALRELGSSSSSRALDKRSP